MKRGAVSLLFATATAIGVEAAPAPHCQLTRAPVVLCGTAENAAAAWHLYGFDLGAVTDPNNQQLILQAGCRFARGSVGAHKILEMNSGKLATRWGFTRVALVVMDGRDIYYVPGRYLRGTCERYSTDGATRDQRPLTASDPTPPTFEAIPGSPTQETPVGKIGVPGSTFP